MQRDHDRRRSASRADPVERRRQLSVKIARLRRRLDRRAGSLLDASVMFGSWRSYVSRHPARSLLAAAGVGMILATAVSPIRSLNRLGTVLSQLISGSAWGGVWEEVGALFAGSKDNSGGRGNDED